MSSSSASSLASSSSSELATSIVDLVFLLLLVCISAVTVRLDVPLLTAVMSPSSSSEKVSDHMS